MAAVTTGLVTGRDQGRQQLPQGWSQAETRGGSSHIRVGHKQRPAAAENIGVGHRHRPGVAAIILEVGLDRDLNTTAVTAWLVTSINQK